MCIRWITLSRSSKINFPLLLIWIRKKRREISSICFEIQHICLSCSFQSCLLLQWDSYCTCGFDSNNLLNQITQFFKINHWSWTYLNLHHGSLHSSTTSFLKTWPSVKTGQGHTPALGLRQDALKQTHSSTLTPWALKNSLPHKHFRIKLQKFKNNSQYLNSAQSRTLNKLDPWPLCRLLPLPLSVSPDWHVSSNDPP